MTQRLALIATAGVAAFIAVVLGALVTYLLLHGTAGSPAFAAPGAAQPGGSQSNGLQVPAPGFGDQQGNDQSPTQQQSGDTQQTNSYPVSADQAANIALSSAPGATLVQQPRLVNMNGSAVYEVALDQGFVYVDATSGQVMYNGANPEQRPRRRFRGPGG